MFMEISRAINDNKLKKKKNSRRKDKRFKLYTRNMYETKEGGNRATGE